MSFTDIIARKAPETGYAIASFLINGPGVSSSARRFMQSYQEIEALNAVKKQIKTTHGFEKIKMFFENRKTTKVIKEKLTQLEELKKDIYKQFINSTPMRTSELAQRTLRTMGIKPAVENSVKVENLNSQLINYKNLDIISAN